ncbi:hypothetical protein [Bradyrhizobium centrosematis]|uniref:hypothetical protein n=1 Tax=Bradyrhizobium centrosematis TaxID=1300039 RepID=UPI00388E8DC4
MTAPDQSVLLDRIEELRGISKVLSARISQLEQSNEQLRAKLHLDPPPPAMGADDVPLKRAAGELGLTVNGVKYHCRKGNLRRVQVGGRVFIHRKSMDEFRARIEGDVQHRTS